MQNARAGRAFYQAETLAGRHRPALYQPRLRVAAVVVVRAALSADADAAV